MYLIGIDEAGRGPCIGPMIMCGILLENRQINELKKLKIKDSKEHTKLQREKLYKILRQKKIISDFKTIKVTPSVIDKEIISSNSNLNLLEAKTSAKIIIKLLNSIKEPNKINKIILDCPSTNIKSYCNIVKEYTMELIEKSRKKNCLKKAIEKIQCEHKADKNYIYVSAASIIAKVTRDKEIDKLQKKYKKTLYGNIGSGYPSDVQTIEFLKNNWKKLNKEKDLFRKTWHTYKKIIENENQKTLLDFKK